MAEDQRVPIRTASIGLTAFLKWAGVTLNGSEGKRAVRDSRVRVNGEVVSQPYRTLHPGDVVEMDGVSYRVDKEL